MKRNMENQRKFEMCQSLSKCSYHWKRVSGVLFNTVLSSKTLFSLLITFNVTSENLGVHQYNSQIASFLYAHLFMPFDTPQHPL